MRRREFITLLGGAAAAWPLAAHAQQTAQIRRVGVLMAYESNDAEAQSYVREFWKALNNLGWNERNNVTVRAQWTGPELAEIERGATDIVRWQPDVILSSSTPTTAALLRQTRTIPVVFAIVSDPVGSGFVKTFAQPGGNATGFTNLDASMGGKWLELLRELVPDLHEVGFVFNPATASYANFYMPSFVEAATRLGLVARAAPVANDEDINTAVAHYAQNGRSGIVVMTDSFTSSHRGPLVRLANQYRVPTVYPYRFFVQEGGLLAYGNNCIEPFRGAAAYVNRILRTRTTR